jgi:hypothetical protein
MRRAFPVVALVVAAIALPVVAVAVLVTAGDGTLVVSKASGIVTVQAQGTFFARVNGTVRIRYFDDGDQQDPVFGKGSCTRGVRDVSDETGNPNDTILVCKGKDVRVRVIDGSFRLRIEGTGMSLSVVGQGRGTLEGNEPPAGTYSINEAPDKSLPQQPMRFVLQAPAS